MGTRELVCGSGFRRAEDRALDVINTGQTEKGFFVVEIKIERMRLGFGVNRDSNVLEGAE